MRGTVDLQAYNRHSLFTFLADMCAECPIMSADSVNLLES